MGTSPLRTEARPIEGYDVVGDVHGHHDVLVRLLARMGYDESHGVWRHPTRKAVFLGDLIDRGAHQVETIRLVQRMVAVGEAQIVLGNHEYNAVAYATEWPDRPGSYARPHDEKNRRQHHRFLEETEFGSDLHRELVEWFCTIPLWLELELNGQRLRVVHACWNDGEMEVLRGALDRGLTLNESAVLATSTRGSREYEALELVLKGPEIDMGGRVYLDKGQHERRRARLRWWNAKARTLRDAALVPWNVTAPDGGAFAPLPDDPIDLKHTYVSDVPVVVGHYWEKPPARLWSPKVACVDYSVAADGALAAYRWSAERDPSLDNIVMVPTAEAESTDEPGEAGGPDTD